MHLFLSIFVESAWAASIVPFASPATFFALKAFGGHDMAAAAAIATLGATLGLLFNWGLGRLLLSRYRQGDFHIPPALYEKAALYFRRYGIFLLLLCWAPMLHIVALIAGFLHIPLKTALPLMLAGEALYYGYYLLS